jgi:hypothetical protein
VRGLAFSYRAVTVAHEAEMPSGDQNSIKGEPPTFAYVSYRENRLNSNSAIRFVVNIVASASRSGAAASSGIFA